MRGWRLFGPALLVALLLAGCPGKSVDSGNATPASGEGDSSKAAEESTTEPWTDALEVEGDSYRVTRVVSRGSRAEARAALRAQRDAVRHMAIQIVGGEEKLPMPDLYEAEIDSRAATFLVRPPTVLQQQETDDSFGLRITFELDREKLRSALEQLDRAPIVDMLGGDRETCELAVTLPIEGSLGKTREMAVKAGERASIHHFVREISGDDGARAPKLVERAGDFIKERRELEMETRDNKMKLRLKFQVDRQKLKEALQ